MSQPQAPVNVHLQLAEWLRNKRQSKLDTLDGIVVDAGKRVELFRGKDLVDAVLGGNFSKLPDVKKLVDGLSREDMPRLCAKLMHANYFHRAVPFELEGATSKKKRRGAGAGGDTAMRVLVDGQRQGVFDEDAIFIWVLPVSQKWLAVQALLLGVFVIFICCIKIWPLWLKIAVWWISLILLVTMLGVLALRLAVAALFWVVGFRGVWLLPNLLDDDIDFFDAFTPVLGKGGEHQARWKKERQQELKDEKASASASASTSTSASAGGEAKDSADKPAAASAPSPSSSSAAAAPKSPSSSSNANGAALLSDWKFGAVNLLLLVIMGILLCNWLGAFAPENIPDFVASVQEKISMFPSLAMPSDYKPPEEEYEME